MLPTCRSPFTFGPGTLVDFRVTTEEVIGIGFLIP